MQFVVPWSDLAAVLLTPWCQETSSSQYAGKQHANVAAKESIDEEGRLVSEMEMLESGTPLCSVKADDLKRVWKMIESITSAQQLVGIDAQLIAEQCESNTNVTAVFFRAALLQYFFHSGLLDDWRDGEEPRATVFQMAACFPMDQGVQGFDFNEFIEHLRSDEISCRCAANP